MLTRRQLLGRAAAGAGVSVLAPSAARASRLRDGTFAQGVLSGDPTPHGITLLTVLHGAEGRGTVSLEVATDPSFRHVVARRAIATGPDRGHSVKARLEGLRAHERYWYRFETRGRHSPVGRFQTALPPDSREPVRFAFFSCAEFTHGYYNAYEALAREDVDFVVDLGDYIYAEAYNSRAGGTGVRDDRTGRPGNRPGVVREAISLADYRAKYALYRSDPALRAMHRRFPMVSIWDDHEVEDDYAGAAPGGGLDPVKRYSRARRAAAYRAFFEAMPFVPSGRSRIYRSLRFGRTVELLMLDERQYRADQPCGDQPIGPCPDADAPRAFLGRPQMRWLERRLSASPAAWKVIGNEVMAMNTEFGGDLFNLDSWQGYGAEREELLQHIARNGIRDVVFVTGDIHTFFAGDVRTQDSRGKPVALEFVGGSITSAGLGEIDVPLGNGQVLRGNDAQPSTPPAILDAVRGANPWLDQMDFDHHGYGLVRATQDHFDCTLTRMRTIKTRTRDTLPEAGFRYRVQRGQRSVKGVNGPA